MAFCEHQPTFYRVREGRIDKNASLRIRKELTEQVESGFEAKVTIEILRAELQAARSQRGWKIARMPYFHSGNVEATPFSVRYPEVLDSVHSLRAFFIGVLAGKQRAHGTMGARARLTLALILWQGVSNWGRLEAILLGVNRASRCATVDDAVIVPIKLSGAERESCEQLRAAVALAAVPLIGAGQPAGIDRISLSKELRRLLPPWHVSGDADVLDVLLEAAAIAHTFEQAPPLRDVWTGGASSVTLSAERVERLFSERAIVPSKPASTSGTTEAKPSSSYTGKRSVLESYCKLREILRVRRGKEKELTYKNARLPANTQQETLRNAIIEDVDAHLATLPADKSPAWLLASYARKLLLRGTSTSPKIELTTVYGYIVGAGAALVRLYPNAALTQLEPEDLISLYQDVVDAVPRRYRPSVATYLSYFHTYLVAEHDAVPMDLRGIGGLIAGNPDVGIVAPREYEVAFDRLKSTRQRTTVGSTHISEQSASVLCLGYASGARSGELVLRQQRELVTESGRYALLVRRNRLGGVKTRRGVRPISLEGWMPGDMLSGIVDDAVSLTGANKHRLPLFPDADIVTVATDPEAIATCIGETLRAVTGQQDARLYWLRHTSTSMEFLYLFADSYMLGKISASDRIKLPFPIEHSPEQMANLLAGSTVLSQFHSSAFRARRGHASILTGLASYIHVVGLIEPYASRETRAALTPVVCASLVEQSHDWVRKVMSRAKTTSASGNALARTLLPKLVRATTAVVAQEGEADAPSVSTVRVGDVYRCVDRYFKTGDLGLAIGLLRSTAAAEEKAKRIIGDLRIEPASSERTPTSLLSVVDKERHKLHVGTRSVDPLMVRAGLSSIRAKGKEAKRNEAFWRVVYEGIDPAEKVIRFSSVEGLETVAEGFPQVFKGLTGAGLALVVGPEVSEAAINRELQGHGSLRVLPVIRQHLTGGDQLPVAVTYVTAGGHKRMATLALLASAWHLHRGLKAS